MDGAELGTALEEKDYFNQRKEVEENVSSKMSALDVSSCEKSIEHCGCEIEEVVQCVENKEREQEKPVARQLRPLYRDEWDCDFCGPECFCEWAVKVEAFGEVMC